MLYTVKYQSTHKRPKKTSSLGLDISGRPLMSNTVQFSEASMIYLHSNTQRSHRGNVKSWRWKTTVSSGSIAPRGRGGGVGKASGNTRIRAHRLPPRTPHKKVKNVFLYLLGFNWRCSGQTLPQDKRVPGLTLKLPLGVSEWCMMEERAVQGVTHEEKEEYNGKMGIGDEECKYTFKKTLLKPERWKMVGGKGSVFVHRNLVLQLSVSRQTSVPLTAFTEDITKTEIDSIRQQLWVFFVLF